MVILLAQIIKGFVQMKKKKSGKEMAHKCRLIGKMRISHKKRIKDGSRLWFELANNRPWIMEEDKGDMIRLTKEVEKEGLRIEKIVREKGELWYKTRRLSFERIK